MPEAEEVLFGVFAMIPGLCRRGGPSPSAGDLRELPRVPLRGEGSCGGGGAPRDSAGSGATEVGNFPGCL